MENTGFSIELIAGLAIFVGFIGLFVFGLAGENRKRKNSWNPDIQDIARNRPTRSWASDAVVHTGGGADEPLEPCARAASRGVRSQSSDPEEWDVELPSEDDAV
jgi:hypothetical protein